MEHCLLFFWRLCVILRILVNLVAIFPFTSKAIWSWLFFMARLHLSVTMSFQIFYFFGSQFGWVIFFQHFANFINISSVLEQSYSWHRLMMQPVFSGSQWDPPFMPGFSDSAFSPHPCTVLWCCQSFQIISFGIRSLWYNAGFLLKKFCSLPSSLIFSWDSTH